MNEPGLLAAGHVLAGRYQVEGVLGEGGMGRVYRARHLGLGQPVAIKILHDRIELLQSEARLLASLTHPALAQVRDFFEEEGRPHLVMELIDGRTLAEVIKLAPKPISERRVRQWAGELLGVLEYLHGLKPAVVVRDLKPDNVMLTSGGQLKLIDFGIARELHPGEATSALAKGMGTEEYAPLEQYGSGSTDERSDLYALGATLFFLLTRKAPPPAWKRAAEGTAVPDPRELNDTVTPAMARALERLLALAPQDRPRDVAAVRALLQEEAHGYSVAGDQVAERKLKVRPGRSIKARGHVAVEVDSLEQVAFSPTQGLLAVAGRSLRLWDLRKRAWWKTLSPSSFRTLAFSADGRWLAAGSSVVTVWELATLKILGSFGIPWSGGVRGLGFLPGGQLAVACRTARARLHDPLTGDLLRKYQPPQTSALSRFFRPLKAFATGAGHVASANSAGQLWVWEGSGLLEHQLAVPGGVSALAWSPDGTFLAAASASQVRLFQAATGQLLTTWDQESSVKGLSFSQDGRLLAVAHADGVSLRELGTGRESLQLTQGTPLSLSFAPERGLLAVGERSRVLIHTLTW